ncbi:MAG: c-type cytochrome biogenesis protein CcsB [Deltaproteobacteria bacterium]|nr:c-type cytochrome biogenesis protein CcsB [Deltaproteobacteria bacterium]
MGYLFFHITATAYLAATLIYTAYLFSHREGLIKGATYALYAGGVAHTVTIISRWVEAGRTPATNLHETLTLFSWIIVVLYAAMLYRYRVAVIGAFVAPLAFLLLITASFLPAEIIPLAPMLESWWLPVHVMLALLGNAFFALASIFAIMYLIQDRYLKSRKIQGLYFILPSVEVLDELSYRCLTYGFPLLTLAIITGAIWSEYALGSYWTWGQRQIWSLITWFLYAALLHGRLTSGWRGKKSAMLSVVAFGVLIGSFLLINVFLGGAHGLLR